MSTIESVNELFQGLFIDDGQFEYLLDKQPLLAHYTSMQVVEKILQEEEIWFSNPLFMNDLEELKFGINNGRDLLLNSADLVTACGSSIRADIIKQSFLNYYNHFDANHVFDTYVFCLTEIDRTNVDGQLSMWRGYGSDGNGAALVFNTTFITNQTDSPLVIARVSYGSVEDRAKWLQSRLNELCQKLTQNNVPNELLYVAAYHFFEAIKWFALTSKHDGFREEREWRLIYVPDRDPQNTLKNRLGYNFGYRGLEPKLKLKIAPLPQAPNQNWSFATILDNIILGPSISSPLSIQSFLRMLEIIDKPNFKAKVRASSIPLRPKSGFIN